MAEGPYHRAVDAYTTAGWQGVIRLPYKKKSYPDKGFTGREGGWPGTEDIHRWRHAKGNIALRLPHGVIGLDVDQYTKKGHQKSGAERAAELVTELGPLPATWSSTRRGPDTPSRISLYRVPEGVAWSSEVVPEVEVIQHDHRYMVVWPSVVHEDQDDRDTPLLTYRWYDPDGAASDRPPRPDELAELPQAWVDRLNGRKSRTGQGHQVAGKWSPILEARLNELRSLTSDDDGRNNQWLTQVAGCLAVKHRDDWDAYLDELRDVDGESDVPHEDSALAKTAESIWKSEQAKATAPGHVNGVAGPPAQVRRSSAVNPATTSSDDEQPGGPMAGYLKRGDFEILHRTRSDDGKYRYKQWADFDLVATGVFMDESGLATGYAVQIRRKSDRAVLEDILPITALAVPSKLDAWLTPRFLTIGAEEPTAGLSGMGPATRLARYLRSQKPGAIRMAPHLGWDVGSGAVLVHDGLIRPGINELVPFGGTRPDPKTRSWASFSYGFVSESEAVSVLREVLTHQDETVSSVFGAWWVMSALKGQYQADLFPVVNVQAVKGSGKSRGFFAEMAAISGHPDGPGQFTPATLRDAVACNRNGIVWVDDLTGIADALGDLIRQATAGGRRSKKEQDNSTTTSSRLVASILVTGEGLGAANEDGALRDRFINLEISPADKRTNAETGRLQWFDMQDLWAKYGGAGAEEDSLTAVAGTLTQMVMMRAPMLAKLSEFRTAGGRHQAKMSILKMGAHILDDVTGGDRHIANVTAWVGSQVDLGASNLGVEVIIPWFLRDRMTPVTAVGHQAAFVDHDRVVWVAPERLADAWGSRHGLSPRERQLGTEDAIRRELKGCDCTEVKIHDTHRGEDRKKLGRGQKRYVRLPPEIAERVLRRTGIDL